MIGDGTVRAGTGGVTEVDVTTGVACERQGAFAGWSDCDRSWFGCRPAGKSTRVNGACTGGDADSSLVDEYVNGADGVCDARRSSRSRSVWAWSSSDTSASQASASQACCLYSQSLASKDGGNACAKNDEGIGSPNPASCHCRREPGAKERAGGSRFSQSLLS